MSCISVAEIETLFKLVIDKFKKDNLENIQFNTDEYWIILTDEWSSFATPPTPAVGSLIEDVYYLKKTIEGNEVFTYSDLDRLASVLRAVSELEAPSN